MAKARKILKHSKTVKSIRTVTRTMEMVASVRFKKAHDMAVNARPFTDNLAAMVNQVVSNCAKIAKAHPLLAASAVEAPVVLLVLTSNRGLCGSFNSAVIRLAEQRLGQYRQAGEKINMHVVGKKGIQYFHYHKVPIAHEYGDFEDVGQYRIIMNMIEDYTSAFLAERISGLEIAYMQFLSAGRQRASVSPILPLIDVETAAEKKTDFVDYEFRPSQEELLKKLLPAVVRQRFYQCFLDSSVSEQVMRINAMHAASDSADDMIHELSIKYNRTRQSQITTEINEIVGGQVRQKD